MCLLILCGWDLDISWGSQGGGPGQPVFSLLLTAQLPEEEKDLCLKPGSVHLVAGKYLTSSSYVFFKKKGALMCTVCQFP